MLDKLVACSQQAALFGNIREFETEDATSGSYSIDALKQHLLNIVQVIGSYHSLSMIDLLNNSSNESNLLLIKAAEEGILVKVLSDISSMRSC